MAMELIMPNDAYDVKRSAFKNALEALRGEVPEDKWPHITGAMVTEKVIEMRQMSAEAARRFASSEMRGVDRLHFGYKPRQKANEHARLRLGNRPHQTDRDPYWYIQ